MTVVRVIALNLCVDDPDCADVRSELERWFTAFSHSLLRLGSVKDVISEKVTVFFIWSYFFFLWEGYRLSVHTIVSAVRSECASVLVLGLLGVPSLCILSSFGEKIQRP